MQRRGAQFWFWADCQLAATERVHRLEDGSIVDVQARTSRRSTTQLFVGVYKHCGRMLAEEFYHCCADETVDQAVAWGQGRARLIFDSLQPFTAPHKVKASPSKPHDVQAHQAKDGDPRRERFLAATRDARHDYDLAKARLMQMMRSGHCTFEDWAKCQSDFNSAIDRWVSLSRTYGDPQPARRSLSR